MISDHLFDNLEDVEQTILSSDVVSIFFPFLGKSLIIDSRTNETHGPIILLTNIVKTPEERIASMRQMRPSFHKIEEIILIPWVRYIKTLQSSGIWEKIVDKMHGLGHEKATTNAVQILGALEKLERDYLTAVVTGPYWETAWEKNSV